MSVSGTTRLAGPFAGTGAAATLPFTFAVQQAADLLVTRDDGVTLVSGTDYTPTLNVDQVASPGGSIAITANAFQTAKNVWIETAVVENQLVQIPNPSGFYPKVIEGAFDKLTMICQEIAAKVSRAVSIPRGDTITALPKASARANMVFGFDANGNPAMLYSAPPTLVQAAQVYRFVYGGGAQTFTLPVTPAGTQMVTRNGIIVDEADWSIAGSTVTIGAGVALYNGDIIRVVCGQTAVVPPSPNVATGDVPTGAIDGANKVFNLAHTPVPNFLAVYRNGVRTAASEWTLSGAAITFTVAPVVGDTLMADYVRQT